MWPVSRSGFILESALHSQRGDRAQKAAGKALQLAALKLCFPRGLLPRGALLARSHLPRAAQPGSTSPACTEPLARLSEGGGGGEKGRGGSSKFNGPRQARQAGLAGSGGEERVAGQGAPGSARSAAGLRTAAPPPSRVSPCPCSPTTLRGGGSRFPAGSALRQALLQGSPLPVFIPKELCTSSRACLHPFVRSCDFSSLSTVWWIALIFLTTEPG